MRDSRGHGAAPEVLGQGRRWPPGLPFVCHSAPCFREELTLDVGTAFDWVAERRDRFDPRIADREYAVEIELRNHRMTGVEIVVDERVLGDIKMTQRSHEFDRKDANTLEFRIRGPAGQEVVLGYAAQVRY